MNITQEIIFDSFSNKRLANLCGQFDENIQYIENQLKINILSHANSFKVIGNKDRVLIANKIIQALYGLTVNQSIDLEQVHIILKEHGMQKENYISSDNTEDPYNHDHQIYFLL